MGIGWKTSIWIAPVLAMGLPAAAVAGDGTFPTEPAGSPFSTGLSPYGVALGDFNNDGNLDLATPNSDAASITVRLGAGNGTFATQPAGSPFGAGSNPESIAVADFNNDGNQDLAVANRGTSNVTVRLGAGDGTFATQPAGSPFAVGSSPYDVAAADLNHDGNVDLVTANAGDGNVMVRLGAGNGTFGAGSLFGAGTSPGGVEISDFNGDADEDLAIINVDSDDVTIRLGAGNGTFGTQPTGSPFGAFDEPRALALGDFNNDGRDDLVIAQEDSNDLRIRLGAGNGTFAAEAPGSPIGGIEDPDALAVGDFNSDRNEDIAVASDDNVFIRLGAGDGTFAAQAPAIPVSNGNGIAVGDVNSDGNEDLAISYIVESVYIRLGAGTPLLAGNLLTNGGAEGAGVARTIGGAPQVPGWTRTAGALTFLRYGIAEFPNALDSARWEGGLGFFTGGPASASSSATQTVDVSASAASIDAGLATASLSALLGGYATNNDRMQVTAAFLDAGGAELGSTSIGPVTAADRGNRTDLLPRSATAPVPAGARSILITITSTRSDGSYNDGYADNVKLTLAAPEPDAPGGGDGGGTSGTTISRSLRLGYKDKADEFKGALKSNEAGCRRGKVKVFEKRKGKDPKVGSDKTNAKGKWSFEERSPDGRFFAKVGEKTVPAGTCPAAKSKTKKVE